MIVLTFFFTKLSVAAVGEEHMSLKCPAGQEFEALLCWKCIVPESIFQSCNPHFFFQTERQVRNKTLNRSILQSQCITLLDTEMCVKKYKVSDIQQVPDFRSRVWTQLSVRAAKLAEGIEPFQCP